MSLPIGASAGGFEMAVAALPCEALFVVAREFWLRDGRCRSELCWIRGRMDDIMAMARDSNDGCRAHRGFAVAFDLIAIAI